MNFTDYLRLSELKIFKNVRDTLPKGLNKSSNLLTIRDGVLYTWNFADNCILTLNLKAARSREGDNVTHQVGALEGVFWGVEPRFDVFEIIRGL